MWSNVKKAIAHMQDNMKNNVGGNRGDVCTCLRTELNKTILNMVVQQMQVSEVHSPPRVVEMANKMGFREGAGAWTSPHKTRTDDHGIPTTSR